MWCAMAECFEKMDRPEDAIKCYLRAEGNTDREGLALGKLARLYSAQGKADSAAHYYEKVLARKDQGAFATDADCVEALLFLAAYRRDNGQFREAEDLCKVLLDAGGVAKDQVKAMLAEIRQLAQHASRR
mgnify:CR=1 FL=1